MPVNADDQGGTNFYALKINPRRAIKRDNQRGRIGLKMLMYWRVHSAYFVVDRLVSLAPETFQRAVRAYVP